MMSLTHVGLRKNAKPGPEKTRPPKYWNLNKKTKTSVPNDRTKPQRPTPGGWSSKKLEKNLQTMCKETKPSLNTEAACTARCQENEITSPQSLNCQKNDYLSRERNQSPPPGPPNPPPRPPPTPPQPLPTPLKTLKQLVPLSPQNTKFAANEGDGTRI